MAYGGFFQGGGGGFNILKLGQKFRKDSANRWISGEGGGGSQKFRNDSATRWIRGGGGGGRRSGHYIYILFWSRNLTIWPIDIQFRWGGGGGG